MAELRCQGVAKAYGGRDVLSEVDLLVAEGTLTAVLGASGSGKTTLLRVIMGFIEADAGTVVVGGSVVAQGGRVHRPADKRQIGYVAQEGALFPHLTAGENVAFGLPRAERKRGPRIAEVLALVGLDAGYAHRRPQELSGGEQRRVALARALAPRPRLVLLDEPFSGLDAALRAETRAAVLQALAQEGTTALLVTHDQAEALSMGSQVAVLRDGRLVQSATPTVLYRSPVDADVALFVGDAVLLPGTADTGRVACALGDLATAAPHLAGPVQVMIRPEQIRIVNRAHPASAGVHAEPGIVGRVLDHTYYGPDTVLRLSLDDARSTIVKVRTMEREIPAPGERVGLAVSGEVVVFGPASGPAGPGAADVDDGVPAPVNASVR